MRALHVLPAFPGEPDEGSAVYSRALTRELAGRGVQIDVLATRSRRLRMRRPFHIDWPAELPRADLVDGVTVRRFRAMRLPAPAGALANRLVQRNWRRIEPSPGGRPESDPATLFATAPRFSKSADLAARFGRGPVVPGLLARVVKRVAGYDVVLASYAPFGLMGWVEAAARPAGVPVVLLPFIHEADPFHHLPSLHRAYARAAAVLTLSQHTAELLRRHLPASRPLAIGAGADLDVFDGAEVSGERFRVAHGLGDRRMMLFVGRKDAAKRYDLALRAAAAADDGAVLVIVGRDVDRRPLPRGVLHLERLEPRRLADAYDACDVLLHPSEQESFGLVCLEAWLRRKPVVANRRCGASAALISDGEDGLLCGSAAEWPAAVARLAAEPGRARSMGEAGREKVLARFTWERVARRVHELYEKVGGERDARAG